MHPVFVPRRDKQKPAKPTTSKSGLKHTLTSRLNTQLDNLFPPLYLAPKTRPHPPLDRDRHTTSKNASPSQSTKSPGLTSPTKRSAVSSPSHPSHGGPSPGHGQAPAVVTKSSRLFSSAIAQDTPVMPRLKSFASFASLRSMHSNDDPQKTDKTSRRRFALSRGSSPPPSSHDSRSGSVSDHSGVQSSTVVSSKPDTLVVDLPPNTSPSIPLRSTSALFGNTSREAGRIVDRGGRVHETSQVATPQNLEATTDVERMTRLGVELVEASRFPFMASPTRPISPRGPFADGLAIILESPTNMAPPPATSPARSSSIENQRVLRAHVSSGPSPGNRRYGTSTESRLGQSVAPIDDGPSHIHRHPLAPINTTASMGTRTPVVPGSAVSPISDSEDDETASAKYSSGWASGYSYSSSRTSQSISSSVEMPDTPDFFFADGVVDRRSSSVAGAYGRRRDPQNKWSSPSFPQYQSSAASTPSLTELEPHDPASPRCHNKTKDSRTSLAPNSSPAGFNGICRLEPEPLAAITEDSTSPSVVASPTFAAACGPRKSRKTGPIHQKWDNSGGYARPMFRDQYQDRPLPLTPPLAGVISPAGDDQPATRSKMPRRVISANGAEQVILRIFEALESFQDISACARLNGGFYRVYKKHELALFKNSMRNSSPAQFELWETRGHGIFTTPEPSDDQWTPLQYAQCQRRDAHALTSLKAMILQHCQVHLRLETVACLSGSDSALSARIDDALWRIWTFCTIFGTPAREHDIDAQIRWLNGSRSGDKDGQLRPSKSCAKSNHCRLSIDDLDDMCEIWNALKMLLQGISRTGRAAQAEAYGLFDAVDVSMPGSVLPAPILLDEWVHWVATQGLSTINDLAIYANLPSTVVFATARAMNCMNWPIPTHGQSRAHFLQLAIAHAQEDQHAKRLAMVKIVADEHKSRGVAPADYRGHHPSDRRVSSMDKGLSLWMEWTSQNESRSSRSGQTTLGSCRSRSPPKTLPAQLARSRRTEASAHQSPAGAGSPVVPPRTSSNALSLFPTVARQPNGSTGVSMSPSSWPSPPKGVRSGAKSTADEARRVAVALRLAMEEDVRIHQRLYPTA